MPYKSEKQRAKFHVLEKQGKISSATVNEFDEASKGMALPTRVRKPQGRGHRGKFGPSRTTKTPGS